MTPRVATILSAREWEPGFVAHARGSSSLRLVMRVYLPDEIAAEAERIDVVVVGSETPWATPARIATWQRLGLRIVGIHPEGDSPGAERLRAARVDEVLPDSVGPETIARVVLLLEPARNSEAPVAGRLSVVTGARGAPGVTEVAVTLAWLSSATEPSLLVDMDTSDPAIAIRLGLPPRPDLTDAADGVITDGQIPESCLRTMGSLAALVASHRPGDPPLRETLLDDILDAGRRSARHVIVDAGPWPGSQRLVKQADVAFLVAAATPTDIVRTSRVTAEWAGPPPHLILNQAPRSPAEAISAIRRWTGLEPAAVIRRHPGIAAASRAARRPHRSLLTALSGRTIR